MTKEEKIEILEMTLKMVQDADPDWCFICNILRNATEVVLLREIPHGHSLKMFPEFLKYKPRTACYSWFDSGDSGRDKQLRINTVSKVIEDVKNEKE